MQFCQPPFRPTGFPRYGQPCGFNANLPNQINGYPDIIGEGNVATIISPDGSTQLLFFPTLQWPQWRTFPQNPYVGNLNNCYLNTLEAWFVRNIFNPIQSTQPTVFPQPNHDYCSIQCPRASTSDCCFNFDPPGLPLKFHNDTCTSTTDIQYFIPKQFKWFRSPTGCASVQVTCPVETTATATACDFEVVCTKPCTCTPTRPCSCAIKDEEKKSNQTNNCTCIRIKKSNSQMSIDCTRSKRSRSKNPHKFKRTKSKNSSHKCERTKPTGSDKSMTISTSGNSRMSVDSNRSQCKERRRRSKKLRSKKSSHTCECKVSASDKCVTTYTEQCIGCAPDIGQETQTSCSSVPIIKVSKGACNSMCYQAEVWTPKPCTTEQAMSQSTISSGQNTCASDSGTSCSTSGTELE